MKGIHPFRRLNRAGASAAALALGTAALVLAAALVSPGPAAQAAPGSPIPARPEQLQYPALKYTPPDPAQYRVRLGNGMPAYMVPDKTVPLITVAVLMRIGPDLDPPGKEGLAAMAMNLLTRSGTTRMTAEQLEERVSFLGATLESGLGGGGGMMGFGGAPISGTEGRITVNLLSKDIDEGLLLLTECLKDCRFQEERLKLRQDQLVQDMKQRNDDSGNIEEYQWGYLLRGEGHWSNRYSTEASVKSITREDMAAFIKRYAGPKNFVLAVSGDFDKGTMVKKLERAFAGWPTPGENPGPPAAPKEPAAQGWFIADKDVNQTRVSIGIRALDRYDPDFFAAQVMNYILGGGGFTSRLVNRIRSDEGLAYSVGTRFEGGMYYPDAWRLFYQTKARSTAFADDISLTEINRIRETPVSDSELETAKNSFIEGFPSRFPSAGGIAGALAAEELTGRYQKDPKYFAEYTQRIGAVTKQDVQRVANRLLDPKKMVFLMVGNATEMMQPDGKHDVTLEKLAGGTPKKIPLRDPLTMKPIP